MITENYDLNVSNGVKELMKIHKSIPQELIAAAAHTPLTSFNDKLAGKMSWKLKEVANIAIYFGVTLDSLILGMEINERKLKSEIEVKTQIREYLVSNKKYKTLGKLEAEGYFNILNKQ